jgi:hypothetical protein
MKELARCYSFVLSRTTHETNNKFYTSTLYIVPHVKAKKYLSIGNKYKPAYLKLIVKREDEERDGSVASALRRAIAEVK